MEDRTTCHHVQQLRRNQLGKLDLEHVKYIQTHLGECPECRLAANPEIQNSATDTRRLGEETSLLGKPRDFGQSEGIHQGSSAEALLDDIPPPMEDRGARASDDSTDPAEPPVKPAEEASNVLPRLDRLGPYQLGRQIGRGGMGTVYAAVHTKLDKPVALKVLPAHLTRDERAVRRFEREMKAVGRLNHPNIVQATDAGKACGLHYLAMELLDGEDLAHLVKRRGPLPIAEACEIARKVAEALQYAHEKDLIHRDVKPSNLMITDAGHVKLLDLGLARLAGTQEGNLTAMDQVLGTLDYLAPEQADDSSRVDGKADVYSLGCTFYRFLCGDAPFPDSRFSSPYSKIVAHREASPPDIVSRRPDLPKTAAELLARMLAKRPEDRPTAEQVALALEPLTVDADLTTLLGDDHERRSITQNLPELTVAGADSKKRIAVGIALAMAFSLCLLACAQAPSIYRIVTNRGQVVVQVDAAVSDDVEVKVVGEDITIGADSGWRIDLKAGTYELQLESADIQMQLSQRTVTVTRNGKTMVHIERADSAIVDRERRGSHYLQTPTALPALNDEDEQGLRRYLATVSADVDADAVARLCRESLLAWRHGDWSSMLEKAQQALKLDPECSVAFHHCGSAYNGLEEFEKALEACTRAIERDPVYASAFGNRGWAYMQLGQHQEAVEDLSHAIELGEIHPQTYVNRGCCYRALRRYREAIEDHTKAIELDRTYAWAYRSRAEDLHESGDYQSAVADYSEAIRLDPTEKMNYANRGVCYANLRRWAEAIHDYDLAIELDHEFAWAYLNRSGAHAALGDADKARYDYTRAVQFNPELSR